MGRYLFLDDHVAPLAYVSGGGSVTDEAEEPTPSTSLAKNSDFVRLWVGEAAAGLGSAIGWLAYPLLASSVTPSAGLAGLLGLVALGAGAAARLPAGALSIGGRFVGSWSRPTASGW